MVYVSGFTIGLNNVRFMIDVLGFTIRFMVYVLGFTTRI